MSADAYLQNILNREAVDTGPYSPVRGVQSTLAPLIRAWAGTQLVSINPSGSFAKGTANASGTDIDLFISLAANTTNPLKEIYGTLAQRLQGSGYTVRRQNVSLNVRVETIDVDLVPAKRQDNTSEDHSLYRRKADTWTKTNVIKHISYVRAGGRIAETRVLKLWRDQQRLDFPSFYLEMVAILALSGKWGGLSDNVLTVLQYLRDSFVSARFVDPANTTNIISDDLTATEKAMIKVAATRALAASNWNQIVT
jgi:hypothetical protein